MSKAFNLHFTDDEESLLAEGKAKFGNKLGSILKDGLRVALNAPAEDGSETHLEPNQEEIAYLMNVFIGDILDTGLDRWNTYVENLRDTMKRRARDMRIKHPKEYPELEYQLRRQHPELEKYL